MLGNLSDLITSIEVGKCCLGSSVFNYPEGIFFVKRFENCFKNVA